MNLYSTYTNTNAQFIFTSSGKYLVFLFIVVNIDVCNHSNMILAIDCMWFVAVSSSWCLLITISFVANFAELWRVTRRCGMSFNTDVK